MSDSFNPRDETAIRLDNHSTRLVTLEEKQHQIDTRVSELENDRETVHNLVTTIGLLAAKVQELAKGVDDIAERAVKKVLLERAVRRKDGWRHTFGLISAGAGAMGAVAGILVYVFHTFH